MRILAWGTYDTGKPRVRLLLEESPLSTREISERLSLSPSDVSKHMKDSSRQSLVRYDIDQQCYALASDRH